MSKKSMYQVINAKIAAMSGRMLNSEDYRKLISFQNPADIAVYLKKHPDYEDVFYKLSPETMRRGELEEHLETKLVNLLSKLLHYFDGNYKNFFNSFLKKFEVKDLKTAARRVHIEKNFSNISDGLPFLRNIKNIKLDQVNTAKNLADLIQALEGTIYFPYLKILLTKEVKETLFNFEMILDKSYFSILQENAKKLSKKDQAAFKELYGTYYDMLNIELIYRGKKYYRLTFEELFNYSISMGHKLDYKKILKLCYAGDLAEFIKILKGTPYAFMLKDDQSQDIFMERRMNRYMYYKFKSKVKGRRNDISSVLAFLELKEFEMRDLISIIENVRYGIGIDEAELYLIKAV